MNRRNSAAPLRAARSHRSASVIQGAAFVCLLALFGAPAHAQWGPDSRNYRFEAQIIGAWRADFQGQTLEVALWPSTMMQRLAGVMVWGDCKAVLSVGGTDLNETTTEVSAANPDLERYLFSFSSYPNQINTLDNRCPGEGRPGYGGFFLNTDESFDRLTIHSYENYPGLQQYPSSFERSVPSPALADAIRWLDSGTSVTLTTLAERVVNDPTLNYFALSEPQRATRLDDIDGLAYVSEFATIYRVERSESINPDRQYFTLVVEDNGHSRWEGQFDPGEIGGEGYFVPASQELVITLYRNTAQCDVVEDPYVIYDLENLSDPALTGKLDDDGASWLLRSSEGLCLNITMNGYCRNVTCTTTLREEYRDSSARPIISSSRNIANAQATLNRNAF